jgi:hypothetical protein
MTRADTVPDEEAIRVLLRLVGDLESCSVQLQAAQERAEQLLAARASGRSWEEIVAGETRPLVVETISTVLGTLSTSGHVWRRQQAAALQAEGVSINRIAAMFGVTRQRISALLKDGDAGVE